MIALRYLKNISLYKITKSRESNGALKEDYTFVNSYKAIPQEINDSISVSLYGAKVDKMYRLITPNFALESYLKPRNNNEEDNISMYMIVFNDERYRIVTSKEKWTDIEYVGKYTPQLSI